MTKIRYEGTEPSGVRLDTRQIMPGDRLDAGAELVRYLAGRAGFVIEDEQPTEHVLEIDEE